MAEKKSFDEIITKNLKGKWCEGLAIVDVSDDEITVNNIYEPNGKINPINNYPILRKEKIFSRVIEMDCDKAIREFIENKKNIISPKVGTDEIITFDGCKHIEYGGNVYQYTKKNEIIVNDRDRFESFDEILEFGFISEKEKAGKWLVF